MAKYRVEKTKFRLAMDQWSVKQFFPATTAGVIEWMSIGGCPIGSTEADVLEKFEDPDGSVEFCAIILRDWGCVGRPKMFDGCLVTPEALAQIEYELSQLKDGVS